jgi:hypothetical protein
MDGERTSFSVTVGTAAVTAAISCTDYTSRLTSARGTGSMVYNNHGDAATIGTQSFTYGSAEQVIAGTAGGTNQTVAYTLNVTGRTVTRVGDRDCAGRGCLNHGVLLHRGR